MSNQLFVGGLSWSTNEENLMQAFQKFGTVDSIRIIYDRIHGRSKGFGFITFIAEESAQNALEHMNGVILDGRNIKVSHALTKPEPQNRYGAMENYNL